MKTQEISGKTLLDLGVSPSPNFGKILKAAKEMEASGDPIQTIFEFIKAENGKTPTKITVRSETLNVNAAITPKTPEEIENLEKVLQTIKWLQHHPKVEGIALMPDTCPAGDTPVGLVVKATNVIIPSLTSADICCSMFASFYPADKLPVADELDILTRVTRFGPGGRHQNDYIHHQVLDENVWANPYLQGLQEMAKKHMGDQGDGNHFAFIGEVTFSQEALDQLENDGHRFPNLKPNVRYRALVTHHGSRGLGAAVYKRGMATAIRQTEEVAHNIPKPAAWIRADSNEGRHYWDALQYIARWTKANHAVIHERFLKALGAETIHTLHNEHNFVWKDKYEEDVFYHGKGATPAGRDHTGRPQLGLIPLNMGEPILIVSGKNNPEFLGFAPHGAGRNLSRTALKNKIGSEEDQLRTIQETTSHIDVRWFSGTADLSETPVAYKNAATVRAQIKEFGLAEILAEIHPLGCIMAGEAETPFWKTARDEKILARGQDALKEMEMALTEEI